MAGDTLPTVQTNEATNIGRTTAKLHGTLTDMGTAPPVMEQLVDEDWEWYGVEPPAMEQLVFEEWSS